MTDQADVVVGEVGRPHGVRGAVRVRATGATLAGQVGGPALRARLAGGGIRDLHLVELAGEGETLIAWFAECATRDDAGGLRGAVLSVPEGLLPATPADEFYVRDLIGCAVAVGGVALGTVTAVNPGPANDVLEVTRGGTGALLLLPFTRDAVVHLDLAERVIGIRDGLLDPADLLPPAA